MTKIRLYLDEDAVERGLVQACRNNGIDIITTIDLKVLINEFLPTNINVT